MCKIRKSSFPKNILQREVGKKHTPLCVFWGRQTVSRKKINAWNQEPEYWSNLLLSIKSIISDNV